MSEQPSSEPPSDPSAGQAEPAADLEYDLTQEATAGLRHPGRRGRGPQHVVQLPELDTHAADPSAAGDLGYDEARPSP